MGDHVFVCYAREDEDFVVPLAAKLREQGVPIWLDQWDIEGGADWDKSIDDAVYDCKRFLIVLSPTAVSSKEVRGELRVALDEEKPIVPLIYQECRIPRQLRTLQYFDFTAQVQEDDNTLAGVTRALGGSSPEERPPEGAQHRASENPREAESSQLTSGSVSGSRTGGKSRSVSQSKRSHRAEQPGNPSARQPAPSRGDEERPPREFRNSIGMQFVLISAGEFEMGSNDGQDDEHPVHTVRISQSFYLGKYPVTQGQWEAVMDNNPSRFKGGWFKRGDPNRPVERVHWNNVQAFLQRLIAIEKGAVYRLPTEAEWEYAARAGSTGDYCFGNYMSQLSEYAWYRENSGEQTHPVGQLMPNLWGVYDMHGNVGEWVQDWYREDYYQQSPAKDPQGPDTGEVRVVRGGGFFDVQQGVGGTFRSGGHPGCDHYLRGFRVVALPKP